MSKKGSESSLHIAKTPRIQSSEKSKLLKVSSIEKANMQDKSRVPSILPSSKVAASCSNLASLGMPSSTTNQQSKVMIGGMSVAITPSVTNAKRKALENAAKKFMPYLASKNPASTQNSTAAGTDSGGTLSRQKNPLKSTSQSRGIAFTNASQAELTITSAANNTISSSGRGHGGLPIILCRADSTDEKRQASNAADRKS